MKYSSSHSSFQLSATDLSNYLSCRHLTNLDSLVAQGQLKKPIWKNPHASALQEMGLEHEADYLEHLRQKGIEVFEISEELDVPSAIRETKLAMERGEEVIAQAVLVHGQWFSRIDILRKFSGKSLLGDYSYEVMDTKLSHETKAGTILQLCLYSEMVEHVTGILPSSMYVVTPGEPFSELEYQVAQYLSYYRLVKSKLLADLESYQETYPDPTGHCDICKWAELCTSVRRADDHLCFVAGLTSRHRKELEEAEIHTLEDLATTSPGTIKKLKHVNTESLLAVREQAVLQLEARLSGSPRVELLELEQGRGLHRLPLPCDGDIFFDLEGDPYYRESGIEYLWGFSTFEKGKLQYHHRWAFNFEEELQCFKWFMAEVDKRKKTYPNLKIYHYASYEPSALKRLMGRYGVGEDELDQLLRTVTFVDLYSITRQSLRAGIEKYSIKDLEQFYQFKRDMPLGEVGVHKRQIEHALELGHSDRILASAQEAVLLYNRDDANSLIYLRKWLEEFRQSFIDQGEEIPRPEEELGEVSEDLSEELLRINKLKESLQAGISPIPEERSASEAAQWLLGDLVGFYRREAKTNFWEKFRLQALDGLELLEDKGGIAGARFMQEVDGGKAKTPIHRYRYPDQMVDIRVGVDVFPEDHSGANVAAFGSVVAINYEEGTIDIKKRGRTSDEHPCNFWGWSHVSTDVKSERLYQFCEDVIAKGIDSRDSRYKAAREILLKKNPDILIDMDLDSNPLELAKTWALNLNHSYLAVQGPPGTGKSYTASRVIIDLAKKGYRVGVTGLSHKVITNLIHKVHEACGKEGLILPLYQKTREDEKDNLAICYLDKKEQIEEVLQGSGPFVFGATDFMWASEYAEDTLDYLVVDEAGQFSLVGILSIAHASKNFILLGDGAQLKQPIQGSHPDGAEISALDHLSGVGRTLPKEKGVFLPTTYRLHPSICQFNSEQFYEGRLQAIEGNDVQLISGTHSIAKLQSNLLVLEVEHRGNSSYSPEEVEVIKKLVHQLVQGENFYTLYKDGKIKRKRIDYDAIKIISPYNAQVNRLKKEIPQVSIGTVDKFQGQEAPVIIYSVATSSPEDAPRGMDFLYSGNRLNVAVSRAECLFVMVATKEIFSPNCKSPAQMKLANSYCRFLELSQIIKPLEL